MAPHPLDRRRFLAALAAGTLAGPALLRAAAPAAPTRPRPTRAQLAWQRDEFALFVHFGVNTFTDREWGDGTESPSLFAPTALDCRQWTRAAKAAGAKALILTAKHHDGFCLWPTATTTHSVAASPFRGGAGDVVREFTDACRAEGLRAGLYLSPWDRNHPTYGGGASYDAVYRAQLTELLTRYGPIHQVWFDGANGEGPNGKRQVYDWPGTWALVRRLQPEAVIFSDAGPDVRWIGNERGVAGATNWSTVDPSIVTRPGMEGAEVMRSLQQGDRDGTVWRPGEADVSIRPGWFWHAAEDARVRTPEDLVDLWYSSVGRNAKLLLNVPPTTQGLFHETDVRHLRAMRERIDTLLADDVSAQSRRRFVVHDARSATTELDFGRRVHVRTIDLRERIEEGQRVAAFTVECRVDGAWHPMTDGTTIGHRRCLIGGPTTMDALRVRITDAVEPPLPITVRAYAI